MTALADPTAATARTLTYQAAALEAIIQAMEADPKVVVMGLGVDDPLPTRNSTGLVEKFGKSRIIGTPLSESTMTGAGIGMAMAGMRPLQVHGRIDFALLGLAQLALIGAKARYMWGGKASVPLTIKGTIGRSWGQGAQHSQGLQSVFAHFPGLRVACPSTPQDMKDVLLWCLKHSQDPAVVIDHRMLHGMTGLVREDSSVTASTMNGRWPDLTTHPDLTIVALSYMQVEARRAVAHLARKHGIYCSLYDPVWVRPLHLDPVYDAVRDSGRLLVVDCGWTLYGIGSEIVAQVAEHGLPLRAVRRLGFAGVPCPTSKALENLFYPNASTIAASAYEMVTGKIMPAWDSSHPEVDEFRGPF